ncbi:hypothetical protein VIGAN_02128400, partial [Vigna angularis var. angularis]
EVVSDNNTDLRDASQRPRRQIIKPSRFSDFETYSDAVIDEEGSLIHIALMAGAEPVDVDDALKQSVWRNAMIEELHSIEKNNT